MNIKIIVFIIIALLLTQLPLIGKYFSVVNTLIHETGHSLMAVLTGGKVQKIHLFSNTEGTAWTSNRFWISRLLTIAAGYVFSSALGCLFMYLIYKGKYNVLIYILITILGVNLLFWVRNGYGLFWMITFCSGFVWLLWKGNDMVIEYFLLFLTSIIVVESITSAFEIMSLSFKAPHHAGDASSLANATFFIPAQVWGIAFFLQSLYFAWLGLKLFFTPLKSIF